MKPMTSEKRTVFLSDHESISYILTQKNIKNIYLRILPDGSVHVSVPLSISSAQGDAFVLSKEMMIRKTLQKLQNRSRQKQEPLQYVPGECIQLLGEPLKIDVWRSNVNQVVRKENTLIILMKKPDDTAKRKKLLDQWILSESRKIFMQVLDQTMADFSVLYPKRPDLKIRSMTSCWGNCHVNQNRITLNLHLAEAPLECIQFVIYHELCHFIHPDHSPNFYQLLETFCPEWKRLKSLLEEMVIL